MYGTVVIFLCCWGFEAYTEYTSGRFTPGLRRALTKDTRTGMVVQVDSPMLKTVRQSATGRVVPKDSPLLETVH